MAGWWFGWLVGCILDTNQTMMWELLREMLNLAAMKSHNLLKGVYECIKKERNNYRI